ncbi:MAG: tRNA (N6-threonylcarbamoyladenosine(37)-N6)-methyltransferase TrmO [Firmicutes bacterium HGW-Firmicutes-7]|nr:MAG: tRNA (N6-threonylcarbamoyladenosine(37)-N6)-methyltransferase TrmO [Firmicutes bacterium HGW-Firmicutes-7]
MKKFVVNPIGKIRICEDAMFVELDEKYIPALKELKGFSHVNVIWWFDDFDHEEARSVLEVSAPYKNSPEIMGIFSTRSPVRPNPIALTAAQIINIDLEKGIIQIAFIDANDGTPVIDLKPYTPSLDRVEMPEVPKWCSHWPKSLEKSGDFDWEKEMNF